MTYSLMDLLDDFVLGPMNLITKAQGFLAGIWYRDMGRRFAIQRADKGGSHSLLEVEAMLKKYGIPTYGGGHNSREMIFRVKNRQARWAEYILTQAGVDVTTPTVDRHNPGYAGRGLPPAWTDQPDRRSKPRNRNR